MAAPTTAARVKKTLANPEPSTHGSTLPTWALQQVVGYPGHTGRDANVAAKTARDPLRILSVSPQRRVRPLIGALLCAGPSSISARVRSHQLPGLKRVIFGHGGSQTLGRPVLHFRFILSHTSPEKSEARASARS